MADTQELQQVDAAEVEKYLGGTDFPTDKDNLLNRADDKGAPQDVLELIARFPDRQYKSAADVARAIGEAKG